MSSKAPAGRAPSFERRVWSGDDVTPELLASALAILQASFARWPPFETSAAPIDHLRWKLDHPGWAPASLVGEMVDDVMAGVTLRLHRRIHVGGRVREARDWVDQCLHPDHRETGIYGRLASTWIDQRVEYDLGVWSTRHPKVVRATRSSEPGQIELGARMRGWLLPLGSAESLAAHGEEATPAWRRSLLSRAAVIASRFRRRGGLASPRSAREPAIVTVARIDDRFRALIETVSSGFDFVQERTIPFLRWRYTDPRGGSFTVLAAEERGEVVGFAAIKVADGLGYVMDVMARPDSSAAPALLDGAVESLRGAGVDGVVCRLPSRHPWSELLPRLGYVDARLPMGYTVSSGRDPLDSLRFLDDEDTRLHLTLGDIDWV